MLCKSFQIVVLCFISAGFVFGQKMDKQAQKEIERYLYFPEKAVQEKESCIVLIKADQDKDTLMIVNNVKEYFRDAIINGLIKAKKDLIFKSIAKNSIIVVSFVYFDDEQSIVDERTKYSNGNICEVILKIKENRNSIIYDPIIILGSDGKRIID